jgi:hypothetical protein
LGSPSRTNLYPLATSQLFFGKPSLLYETINLNLKLWNQIVQMQLGHLIQNMVRKVLEELKENIRNQLRQ